MMLKNESVIHILTWIIFASLAAIIFIVSWGIKGPFIFLDETTYFDLSRQIFKSLHFSGRQYNPLYPLILAPLFSFNDPVNTFIFARLLNAIFFASCLFPYHLIARKLISNRWLALIAAIIATTMPFGAYSFVIWAEPLYYPLVGWAFALFLIFSERPTATNGVLLGVALALAFFTKQAALLLTLSVVIAFVSQSKRAEKAHRWGLIRKQLLVLALGFCLPMIWIIRNRLLKEGGGGLGYQDAWNKLMPRLANPMGLFSDCLSNVFFSLSYFAVALYGVFFVVFLWACVKRAKLPQREASLTLLLMLFSIGLLLLCSVFLTAYGAIDYSNGRYFDAVTPIILIFAVSYLNKIVVKTAKQIIIMSGIVLAVGANIYLFSPLRELTASSFINNASISYMHQIFSTGGIMWSPFGGTPAQRLLIALMIYGMTTLIFLSDKKIIPILILLPFQIFASVSAYTNVYNLGKNTDPINVVFRKLSSDGIISNRENGKKMYLDESLRDGTMAFIFWFWAGNNPEFVNVEDVELFGGSLGLAADSILVSEKVLNIKEEWRLGEMRVYSIP